MIGHRSGRLVVTGGAPSENGRAMWTCLCDCGASVVRMGKYLRREEVKSCGCLNRQGIAGPANERHGHAPQTGVSPTYTTWAGMVARCTNPRASGWHKYGARGVNVCPRWLDFAAFLADMGERPQGKSIDRHPDAAGDYEPGNCRWATPTEQNENTRTARWIEHGGERRTLSSWARHLGVSAGTLHGRLARMSVAEALKNY